MMQPQNSAQVDSIPDLNSAFLCVSAVNLGGEPFTAETQRNAETRREASELSHYSVPLDLRIQCRWLESQEPGGARLTA
jgi:hypothetical protein